MNLTMMKAKLHRAVVTEADLNYEGSISIDTSLLKESGILVNEKVDIYNIDNGERFSTYVIEGREGQICLNGAAARRVHRGDKVIIVAYAQMAEKEAAEWKPEVLLLDENNKIKRHSI